MENIQNDTVISGYGSFERAQNTSSQPKSLTKKKELKAKKIAEKKAKNKKKAIVVFLLKKISCRNQQLFVGIHPERHPLAPAPHRIHRHRLLSHRCRTHPYP